MCTRPRGGLHGLLSLPLGREDVGLRLRGRWEEIHLLASSLSRVDILHPGSGRGREDLTILALEHLLSPLGRVVPRSSDFLSVERTAVSEKISSVLGRSSLGVELPEIPLGGCAPGP